MDESDRSTLTLELPDDRVAEEAMERARRVFHRSLAGWVSDILVLRRAGLSRIEWFGTSGQPESWSKAA